MRNICFRREDTKMAWSFTDSSKKESIVLNITSDPWLPTIKCRVLNSSHRILVRIPNFPLEIDKPEIFISCPFCIHSFRNMTLFLLQSVKSMFQLKFRSHVRVENKACKQSQRCIALLFAWKNTPHGSHWLFSNSSMCCIIARVGYLFCSEQGLLNSWL